MAIGKFYIEIIYKQGQGSLMLQIEDREDWEGCIHDLGKGQEYKENVTLNFPDGGAVIVSGEDILSVRAYVG